MKTILSFENFQLILYCQINFTKSHDTNFYKILKILTYITNSWPNKTKKTLSFLINWSNVFLPHDLCGVFFFIVGIKKLYLTPVRYCDINIFLPYTKNVEKIPHTSREVKISYTSRRVKSTSLKSCEVKQNISHNRWCKNTSHKSWGKKYLTQLMRQNYLTQIVR